MVINGGHLYNYNTSAIRQFCNSTTNENSVTINGGLIEGYCAIWIQNPGKKTVNGKLTITGGELKSTASAYVNGTSELKDVNSRLYCTIDGDGGAWSQGSYVKLTGGTFNENVALAEDAPVAVVSDDTTFNGYLKLPESGSAVAQIGEIPYATLQDAIDKAASGDTITLLGNIDVDLGNDGGTAFTVAADDSITLDLNGYAITGPGNAVNKSCFLLVNNGTLVINDSSKAQTGKIQMTTSSEWSDWVQATPVANKGKLTLESGSIIAARGGSSTAMTYAIDTQGAGVTTITGGLVQSDYLPLRAFGNASNPKIVISGNAQVTSTDGKSAIFIQLPGSSANKAALEVTGGTISSPANNPIYIWAENAGTVTTTIKGGNWQYSANLDVFYITDDSVKFTHTQSITGGTFSSDPGAYVADGYRSVAIGDKFVVIPTTQFVITFQPNGGNFDAATSFTGDGAKLAELLKATHSNGNYTFKGWFTAASGGDQVTTDTVFTGDTTIYAQWIDNTPSSGGGGGSSSSKPTTSTTTNPDGSTTTTTTDKNGTKTEVTENTDGSTTTVVTDKKGNVTTTEEAADGTVTTTVEDPKGNVTTTVEDTEGNVTETVEAADGTVTTTVEDTEGNVTETVENTDGSVEVTQTLSDGTTVATVTDADGAITADVSLGSDYEDGATVTIPVSDLPVGAVAIIVHEDGTEEVVSTSVVTEDGLLVPLEEGASLKIVDNSQDFNDISNSDWHSDAVDFVSSRNIFNGTGNGNFSPNTAMNRAMVAQVLYNLEKNPASGEADFADMSGDEWYAPAAAWASENGIVKGHEDGSFCGEDPVSREQLAVMLWRYVGEPASSHDIGHFGDADQISDYAKAALAWANENGIINGTSSDSVSPKDDATRAQVAQMMKNFIEWMVK